jgi:hypothetical protein
MALSRFQSFTPGKNPFIGANPRNNKVLANGTLATPVTIGGSMVPTSLPLTTSPNLGDVSAMLPASTGAVKSTLSSTGVSATTAKNALSVTQPGWWNNVRNWFQTTAARIK